MFVRPKSKAFNKIACRLTQCYTKLT